MTTTTQEHQSMIEQALSESQIEVIKNTPSVFFGTPVPITGEQATGPGTQRPNFLFHTIEITAGDRSRADEYINMAYMGRASGGSTYELIANEPATRMGVQRSAIGVSGAVMSPILVNGKVYSCHNSFTVQYFDDDHVELRNEASSPFNILNFRGEPWPITTSTSMDSMPSYRYIQIVPPENAWKQEDVSTPAVVIGHACSRSDLTALNGASFNFFGAPVEYTQRQAIAAGIGTNDAPVGIVVTGNSVGNGAYGTRLKLSTIPDDAIGNEFFAVIDRGTGEAADRFVKGAILNPTLVNGKTYSSDGSYTVQYFDEENRTRRNTPGNPFNVLNYRGGHDIGTNSIGSITWYVEIEPPENAVTMPDAQAAADSGEQVTLTGDELLSRVMADFVEYGADADSPVTMPLGEIERGHEYIVHNGTSIFTTFVDTDRDLMDVYEITSAVVENGQAIYSTEFRSGYMNPTRQMTFYKTRRSNKPQERTAEQQATQIEALTTRVAAATSRWNDMGGALNDMAREESWCGEYEEAVHPLGWPGRRGGNGGNAEYDITVSVSWEFDDGAPSTSFDSDIASNTDIDTNEVSDFEVNTLRMDGSATVVLRGVEMPVNDEDEDGDELDFDDYITTEALQDLLPSGYTVEGWEYQERAQSES